MTYRGAASSGTPDDFTVRTIGCMAVGECQICQHKLMLQEHTPGDQCAEIRQQMFQHMALTHGASAPTSRPPDPE